jgi:hypothetical protein
MALSPYGYGGLPYLSCLLQDMEKQAAQRQKAAREGADAGAGGPEGYDDSDEEGRGGGGRCGGPVADGEDVTAAAAAELVATADEDAKVKLTVWKVGLSLRPRSSQCARSPPRFPINTVHHCISTHSNQYTA